MLAVPFFPSFGWCIPTFLGLLLPPVVQQHSRKPLARMCNISCIRECTHKTLTRWDKLIKTLPSCATCGQKLCRVTLKQEQNIFLRKLQALNQHHRIPHRNILSMREGRIISLFSCAICQWVNSTGARVAHQMNCSWICSSKQGQLNQTKHVFPNNDFTSRLNKPYIILYWKQALSCPCLYLRPQLYTQTHPSFCTEGIHCGPQVEQGGGSPSMWWQLLPKASSRMRPSSFLHGKGLDSVTF